MKILVSPGYGAGWTTWNRDHDEFLLSDPGLVALAEQKADVEQVEAYLKEKLGPGAYVYCGGWRDITVEDIPAGTKFRIHEYDGFESVEYRDEIYWYEAT